MSRPLTLKNQFNTHKKQLPCQIPGAAHFNEFYPKRSGPTIPLHPCHLSAGALPIESFSLSPHDDPIDANDGQQQRERREGKDCRAVEVRAA
jgi:hypothetical protein